MKYPFLISAFILVTGFSAKTQSLDHDIQKSFQQAQENSQYVLMVFSGSDWCKPCIQFKQKILSNKTFTDYSSNRLLLHEVDFPYKRKNKLSKAQQKHNDMLAGKYNKEGVFPRVLLFNEHQELIAEINYKEYMTVDQFINQLRVYSKTEKL